MKNVTVRTVEQTENYGIEVKNYYYENVIRIIFGEEMNEQGQLQPIFRIIYIYNIREPKVLHTATFWQKNTQIELID